MAINIFFGFALGCFVIGLMWMGFSPLFYKLYTSQETAEAINKLPELQTFDDTIYTLGNYAPWVLIVIGIVGVIFGMQYENRGGY